MKEFDKFKQELELITKVAIVCHRKPDADAIGSMLAMENILKKMRKNIRLVCVDEIADNEVQIFGEVFIEKSISGEEELVIFMDCSCLDISGLDAEMIGGKRVASIDHHASHDSFGDLNIVQEVSSTCELVFDMYQYFDLPIEKHVAIWLLAGISFDTGGLRHDCTSAKVLRIVKELTILGANLERINNVLFKQCSAKGLRMYGRIFGKSKINKNGVLSCVVAKSDMSEIDCCQTELKKAIDYLNQIQGSKMALLGFEEEDDSIKFSMRSKLDEYDVSKIAQLFEGGGHKKAAGFRVEL